MTTLLWTLIAIQIAMAAFDTIYHHELTERLAWRPSQRHELSLHAARSFVYVALFVVLGFLELHGAFAMLVIAALAVEVVITLADFIEEDMSRKLPATERRYDIGNFPSYFETFVEFALADPQYGAEFRRFLERTLKIECAASQPALRSTVFGGAPAAAKHQLDGPG